jgi:hypothetical protein
VAAGITRPPHGTNRSKLKNKTPVIFCAAGAIAAMRRECSATCSGRGGSLRHHSGKILVNFSSLFLHVFMASIKPAS